jgi:hypothetical protein
MAVGRLFVDSVFGVNSKYLAEGMVMDVIKAFEGVRGNGSAAALTRRMATVLMGFARMDCRQHGWSRMDGCRDGRPGQGEGVQA